MLVVLDCFYLTDFNDVFAIDKRFLNDCSVIMEHDGVSYLLHNNAEVLWFILLPHTRQTEFYQLEAALQNHVCTQINQMSVFIQSHFEIDKINVATIGNVVSQLHIHVIGRRRDDVYWPDVVWGKGFDKTYSDEQRLKIGEQLIAVIGADLI